MRKSAIALAAVAMFGGVSIASAADVTGMIKSIDTTTKSVTLDNGSVYKLPTTFDAAKFKIGDKVKVTYTGTGSDMTASDIQPAT